MNSLRWFIIYFTFKAVVYAYDETTEAVSDLKFTDDYASETSTSNYDEEYENKDIVYTENGPVQGHIHENKPTIKIFYDIPYGSFSASDPFEEPSPSERWDTIHNTSEHKSRCPQIGYPNEIIGGTDCLTLSIMTPTTTSKSDVLFYIHDGSFNNGSGNPSIYGPEYIVPQGIILVLPNYRLGALGFLCLQNETIPGNAALKDLTLALKWVKDNIAAFGGDPSNIVVSGDGNAGILAGYLAISPRSRDLFSKIIVESGFILSPLAIDRNPIKTAENLLEQLSNPINPVISKYHRNQNFHVGAYVTTAKNMKFAPCIENGNKSFIAETPWAMLNKIKTNVSYMIGITNHAGIHEALQHTEITWSEVNNNFSIILPSDLHFRNAKKMTEIGNRIKLQYFGDQNITSDTKGLLSFYYTDSLYLGPMIRAARPLVAAGASVYLYEFAFVGKLNQEILSPIKFHGASRGDIARYIFCKEGQVVDDDTKEKRMVETVVELWKNFIRTGKPSAKGIQWDRLHQTTEVNESWLLIDSEVKPKRGFHVERIKQWTEIYETYFVEHNRAFGLSPYLYSLIFTLSIFICLSKFLV